jgi:hypothetical protein
MTSPKFNNKDGTLTGIAFACGYVEKYGAKTFEDGPRATLSKEPNDYHVKGFDHVGVHFWESFEKVADARKFARKVAGPLIRK